MCWLFSGKSASDAAKAAAQETVDDEEEEEAGEVGPSVTTQEITVKCECDSFVILSHI